MKNSAPSHPWLFFALIFGLSAPFWILSTQLTRSVLSENFPITDIGATFTPTIAAVILRYREAGATGVRELLLRIFDYRRIKNKRWLVIAVVIFPLLYLVTYFIMQLLGYPVATVWSPSPSLIGLFVLFFVAATAEEIGYSAFETDALQRRMTALSAALVMGPFWALWHLPSMIGMGQTTELILWGLCATVTVRILCVWIYNNAGTSVLAVILMHVIASTSRTAYPGGRSGYELGEGSVAYSVIIVFAVIVVFIWRPSTLANFLGRKSITPAMSDIHSGVNVHRR